MKNKIKYIIYFFLFFTLLFFLGVTIYICGRVSELNSEYSKNIDYVKVMGAANDIQNCYFYVVNDKESLSHLYYGGIYYGEISLISQKYDFLDVLFGIKEKKGIYNEIKYYDVATGEELHNLNIRDVIKNRGANVVSGENLSMNGKHYYIWKYQVPNGDYWEIDYNLDEKVYEKSEVDRNGYSIDIMNCIWNDRNNRYNDAMDQHIMTNESFLKANDLSGRFEVICSVKNSFGYIYVIKIGSLPFDNSYFNSEFPSLSNIANEIPEGYIMFQIPYDMEVSDIVRLFSDNCEDISFEGVFIDRDSSLDGLEHTVNSIDDYNTNINTDITGFSLNYEFWDF